MDLFSAQMWYGEIFNFKETEAFSPVFELFGMGDMNFMMLTSSIPIIFCLIIVYWLILLVLKITAKRHYKYSKCRRVGMFVERRMALSTNVNTFLS